MPRDEFFRDVRRAVSIMTPRVVSDSPFVDVASVGNGLRGADLWLVEGTVAAFRAEDFADLDETTRDVLVRAVEDFREVARTVPAKAAATTEQRAAAMKPFETIAGIVGNLLRTEWIHASNGLLDQAEHWANEAGWPCRRYEKAAAEEFIGGYVQQRLVFSAEGAQLALIPVGRFAPGSDGLFDLAVMPTYDSVMVVRRGGRWFIHSGSAEGEPRIWSKEAFLESSSALARLP